VIPVTEATLVNTLTSTSLASRSRLISVLGRYNQKYSVVEMNTFDCVMYKFRPAVEANNPAAAYCFWFLKCPNRAP
jgi:hypothetical protein